MPGTDERGMNEATHEQRVPGAAAPRAEETDSVVVNRAEPAPSSHGGTSGTAGSASVSGESGQPRKQRRITQAERAAFVMKKGKHLKALLWVSKLGAEVISYMVEATPEPAAYSHPDWTPQQWLDHGWRIASWFANPKTGTLQITLIRPI